jgi:hypothetical protein
MEGSETSAWVPHNNSALAPGISLDLFFDKSFNTRYCI